MSRLVIVLLAGLLVVFLAVAATVVGIGALFVPVQSTVTQGGPTPLTETTVAEAPTATPPPAATPTPVAQPTATVAATPTTAEGNERAALYGRIVEEHLADLPGTFGVVVKDLKTGDTYSLNADRVFPAASLYKLGLMYEVIRQGETGELDLERLFTVEERHMAQSEFDEKLPVGLTISIDRSLWFLITLSSNSAAMALNDFVEWSEVNRSMRKLGLVNTRMAGDPTEPAYGDWRDDTPSTTPNEMLRFFEMLYHQELLSEEASEKMMYLLRNQQIDDRLSVKLPEGVVMAHKTGNLPGTINDVGIIFGPKTDLFVAVLSQDADYEMTTSALQDLGLALYRAANE